MTNTEKHDDQYESRDEWTILLAKLAQHDLSEPERVRLCTLLSESDEARWAYIHAIHLEQGIKRWSRTQGEADVWAVVDLLRQSDDSQDMELAGELEELAMDDALLTQEALASQRIDVVGRHEASSSKSTRTVWSWRRSTSLAAAASLLVAITLWRSTPRQGDALNSPAETLTVTDGALAKVAGDRRTYALSDSENVVARVTSASGDILWSRGGEPQDFLMRFRPGDVIGAKKGLIQIEFSAGAVLVVESPAVFQVTSATSARLIQGRVVGRAENGNFTLLTPTASVVDIGTEFGVGVSDGGTDVTVFEGEVHVHTLLGSVDAGSMQKLQRGMSVRVDAQGMSNSRAQPNRQRFQRNLDRPDANSLEKNSVSLLDLVSGHETTQQRIAGSIDPQTGYWGRPPWLDPQQTRAQRGDTQFAQTDWNPMVDGVFIPRSNAREMQIDSDGHMVYLPPNKGSTWGPIWARRRLDQPSEQTLLSTSQQVYRGVGGYWGAGALSQVLRRLQRSRDGLMGLHANVGITFDLNAVRESRSRKLNYFKAVVANLDSSARDDSSVAGSVADLRVFVDGKLRYSRLQFARSDGEAALQVALSNEDRFLTIVTTDAGADPEFDHVVLIDPVLEFEPRLGPPPDQAALNLHEYFAEDANRWACTVAHAKREL